MSVPIRVRLKSPYRVTIGSEPVALTGSGNVHGVVLKAICPGQVIYIGLAGVTTANGYPMANGETLTLEVQNASELYAIGVSGEMSVLPFRRL